MTRFSEEQIITILREARAGTPTSELVSKHGISRNTFYNWRRKYGGMDVSHARELRHLRKENRRLSRVLDEQTRELSALRDALRKKW